MTATTYWMNFYVNKSDKVSMLAENPLMGLTEALQQIDDCDGYTDRLGTLWTYTHTLYMNDGKPEVINMTEMVKEMNEEARLDRIHNCAVTNGLKEMQS